MYIRKTTIKSKQTGEPYFTYRLVESVRIDGKVRQKTLLNLGRNFDVPQELWPDLIKRIEQLILGQGSLFPTELTVEHEKAAQRYSALIVRAKSRLNKTEKSNEPDYQNIDINSIEMVRPRSVSIEHVCLETLRELGLEEQLENLGFNKPQRAAAIGIIIGRMTEPGSELSTYDWLQNRSGLGELINFDYTNLKLNNLYRISDQIYKNKEKLESFLFKHEKDLFQFENVVTLYDLTNTYFEGTCKANKNAHFGRSKEKRSDCKLVTLAMVLDASGFPKKSEIFEGNVSEPKTLSKMLGKLSEKETGDAPTVVMDAGIATDENIVWLRENHYRYIVVSRKRNRRFSPDNAVTIKNEGELHIQAQRIINPDTGEVELFCKSSQRQKKEEAIDALHSSRFEEAISHLAKGLHKKGTTKIYDKVLERIGRIKQKYSTVAQDYKITVTHDENKDFAIAINCKRKKEQKDKFPGVYCLRTNQEQWDESTLWHVYIMLTNLEAVFRSLKSELGLRPVFHHTTERVSAHLFISVLAYHIVHTIRFQLKNSGIHFSWKRLRQQLKGQERITVELKGVNGKIYHIRKASRPEPRQKRIYQALALSDLPGATERTLLS